MHGLMALDAECVPITPLITWADSRARQEASSVHRTGQAADIHAAMGVPVHPMTSLTMLLWFAEHGDVEIISGSGQRTLDSPAQSHVGDGLSECGLDHLQPVSTSSR